MTKDRRPQRGFSRREFIQAAAAATGGTIFTTPTLAYNPRKKSRPNHPDPDLILVDGRIHTMDARNRVVSSVAIKDGRFIEVGSVGRSSYGRETKVIDLNGRTVVPGIIDNHNHMVLMGNRPGYHTPLENAYSIPDVQAIYKARAAGIPSGAWITTIGGFHFNHIYANPADPHERPPPDARRARRCRSEQPGVHDDLVHGPGSHQQPGQGRSSRARASRWRADGADRGRLRQCRSAPRRCSTCARRCSTRPSAGAACSTR